MAATDDRAAVTRDGVQVLGLTRFSVPSVTGFRKPPKALAERRAFLYDPARLALRFAWFEHVHLPALAAQSDPDFRHIVVLGEDFPEPWRARMEALAAGIPQLVLSYAAPIMHRQAYAEAIERQIDPGAKAVIQFRMDDDDGVTDGFVRDLRRDFRRARGLFRQHGLLALDHNRGITLHADANRGKLVARHHAHCSVAIAIVTRPGDGHHVLDYFHDQIWRDMPALSFPGEMAWVRGVHGDNDSGTVSDHGRYKMDEGEMRKILRRRFKIDLSARRAALRAQARQYPQAGAKAR